MMNKQLCQYIALLMAKTCVRDTIIEQYHAKGKITNSEMADFNREVVNKLYTFMHHLFGADEDKAVFLEAIQMHYPTDWDQPTTDKDIESMISLFHKLNKK